MKLAVLVTALAIAIPVIVSAAEPAPRASVHRIEMSGMKFIPAKVSAKPGDTVTWTNTDIVPHTVVGPDFSSPVLKPGESFSWTAKPGEYDYICSLHPMMRGSIQVK